MSNVDAKLNLAKIFFLALVVICVFLLFCDVNSKPKFVS